MIGRSSISKLSSFSISLISPRECNFCGVYSFSVGSEEYSGFCLRSSYITDNFVSALLCCGDPCSISSSFFLELISLELLSFELDSINESTLASFSILSSNKSILIVFLLESFFIDFIYLLDDPLLVIPKLLKTGCKNYNVLLLAPGEDNFCVILSLGI